MKEGGGQIQSRSSLDSRNSLANFYSWSLWYKFNYSEAKFEKFEPRFKF